MRRSWSWLEDRAVVPAINNVWMGESTSGNWPVGAPIGGNWSLGTAPTSGETLAFGTTATGSRNLTDNIAGLTIDAISFQDTGYTISPTTTASTILTFSDAATTILSDTSTVGGNLINGKVTATGTI